MSRKSGFRKDKIVPRTMPDEAPAVANQNTNKTQSLTTQKKKLQDIDNTTVGGAVSFTYDFKFISGRSYYNGRTNYGNGTNKDVSFVPLAKAKANKIFHTSASNSISDEGLLVPHYLTYCEDISKYIICYDRFECSLKEWLQRWINPDRVKDENGLPHKVIRTQISNILKSVHAIHKKGLLHSSLADISNYVVIDGNWRIINISDTIDKSDQKWELKVINDFRDFRDMLENNVLLDTSWRERNDFFETFDMANLYRHRFVHILLNNVFTKSPKERLQMFSVIYHRWLDRSHNMLHLAIQKGKFHQYTDGGWDNVQMSQALLQVYNYPIENGKEGYDGKSIFSLIKFLRNVYEHYHNGDVHLIEREVRQLWPGLLEKLHLYY